MWPCPLRFHPTITPQPDASGRDELTLDNTQIHSHPEILFQERHAHKVLSDFLEQRGFEVHRGAFGLETAFKATYGPEGARAVAINLEYVTARHSPVYRGDFVPPIHVAYGPFRPGTMHWSTLDTPAATI